MIDDLVAELKKKQQDDENKKEYCDTQFDLADDKKKALEKSHEDLETAISESKENIQTTKEEIDALEDGVRALDKFYNPKLYKPPAAMAQVRVHSGVAPPPPPEA